MHLLALGSCAQVHLLVHGSCVQVHFVVLGSCGGGVVVFVDVFASLPVGADKEREIQFVPNGGELAVAKHSIVFR